MPCINFKHVNNLLTAVKTQILKISENFTIPFSMVNVLRPTYT